MSAAKVAPIPQDDVVSVAETTAECDSEEAELTKMSTAEVMAAAVAAVEKDGQRKRRFSVSETPTRLMQKHGLMTPSGAQARDEEWSAVKVKYNFVRQSSLDDLVKFRPRRKSKVERWGDGIPKGGHESLDYDEAEKDQLRAVAELPAELAATISARKGYLTGALLVAIGLSAGSIAYVMTRAISYFSELKWDWVQESVTEGNLFEGWLKLIGFSAPLALLAALLTYWCPDAAGSGIPYVKSYLNGNGLKLASFSTLVVKVVGISCMVICGVPVGREGPMVHSGAVVAAVLTRVWAHLVHWHLRMPFKNTDSAGAHGRHERLLRAAWTAGGYDNDRDRRNFVSMGAAAGVAAAFNAPIGGILFSLEEVSSFWDQQLTWTTFLAAAVAAFTVNYWSSGMHGTFADGGLVLFASGEESTTYELWELIPFTLMGVLCGAVGALFNDVNRRITLRRKALLGARPKLRVLEAVATVMLVVSVYYWAAEAYGCTAAPDAAASSGGGGGARRLSGAASLHAARYTCAGSGSSGSSGASGGGDGDGDGGGGGDGGEMNEMATLLLQPMEAAVVQLFTRGTPGYFTLGTLAVFVPLYFASAVFTYGIAVPSGLFIPCMMMGAGTGRFCGEAMRAVGLSSVDPGVYALVGAAGMLGGVTRMTISLAVILVEVSNDIQLLLPIMLAILLAKAVGDRFTRSLYDIHILLSGATLLAVEPTPHSTSYLLTARSLLEHRQASQSGASGGASGGGASSGRASGRGPPLKTVTEAETLRRLSDLLDGCTHHAFPVISEQSGGFAGLIGRTKLEALVAQVLLPLPTTLQVLLPLSSGAYTPPPVVAQAEADGARRRQRIDLRPHYDHAPYTVHELLPLYRVSRLFMSMGLRHLCVLDGSSAVVGIITRKDLATLPTSLTGDGDSHLNASKHGATTMKRMLDARHQASHAKVAGLRSRRMSDPGVLNRHTSEPNVLSQTPPGRRPGHSNPGAQTPPGLSPHSSKLDVLSKDLAHVDRGPNETFNEKQIRKQRRPSQAQLRLMKRRASV